MGTGAYTPAREVAQGETGHAPNLNVPDFAGQVKNSGVGEAAQNMPNVGEFADFLLKIHENREDQEADRIAADIRDYSDRVLNKGYDDENGNPHDGILTRKGDNAITAAYDHDRLVENFAQGRLDGKSQRIRDRVTMRTQELRSSTYNRLSKWGAEAYHTGQIADIDKNEEAESGVYAAGFVRDATVAAPENAGSEGVIAGNAMAARDEADAKRVAGQVETRQNAINKEWDTRVQGLALHGMRRRRQIADDLRTRGRLDTRDSENRANAICKKEALDIISGIAKSGDLAQARYFAAKGAELGFSDKEISEGMVLLDKEERRQQAERENAIRTKVGEIRRGVDQRWTEIQRDATLTPAVRNTLIEDAYSEAAASCLAAGDPTAAAAYQAKVMEVSAADDRRILAAVREDFNRETAALYEQGVENPLGDPGRWKSLAEKLNRLHDYDGAAKAYEAAESASAAKQKAAADFIAGQAKAAEAAKKAMAAAAKGDLEAAHRKYFTMLREDPNNYNGQGAAWGTMVEAYRQARDTGALSTEELEKWQRRLDDMQDKDVQRGIELFLGKIEGCVVESTVPIGGSGDAAGVLSLGASNPRVTATGPIRVADMKNIDPNQSVAVVSRDKSEPPVRITWAQALQYADGLANVIRTDKFSKHPVLTAEDAAGKLYSQVVAANMDKAAVQAAMAQRVTDVNTALEAEERTAMERARFEREERPKVEEAARTPEGRRAMGMTDDTPQVELEGFVRKELDRRWRDRATGLQFFKTY